jgi:hypothetical protein
MSEKLRETLLTEAQVTDEDRRRANLDAAAFVFKLQAMMNELKNLRKKHGAIFGKQFKKTETDLLKVSNTLNSSVEAMTKKLGR